MIDRARLAILSSLKLAWNDAALEAVARMPSGTRKSATHDIEVFAITRGYNEVTMEVIEKARAASHRAHATS